MQQLLSQAALRPTTPAAAQGPVTVALQPDHTLFPPLAGPVGECFPPGHSLADPRRPGLTGEAPGQAAACEAAAGQVPGPTGGGPVVCVELKPKSGVLACSELGVLAPTAAALKLGRHRYGLHQALKVAQVRCMPSCDLQNDPLPSLLWECSCG